MARPRRDGDGDASRGFTADSHLRLPAHPVPTSPPRRPRFLQRPARAAGAQTEVSCSCCGCDPASASRRRGGVCRRRSSSNTTTPAAAAREDAKQHHGAKTQCFCSIL
uniref:Uncharacterized protein n=1 Tax=Oryza glumipatula TaxID=40148 RepID=A0A0D9Y792_9ORYZ